MARASSILTSSNDVGEGELAALEFALANAVDDLVYVGGRQSVLDGAQGRIWRSFPKGTRFPARWRRIGVLVESFMGRSVAVKVESHVTREDIIMGFSSPFLAKGNELADQAADEAAARAQVPPAIAARYLYLEEAARVITVRAAAAVMAASEAAPKLRCARAPVRPRISKRELAIRESGHALEVLGFGASRCTRCKQVVPKDQGTEWLLNTPRLQLMGASGPEAPLRAVGAVSGRADDPSVPCPLLAHSGWSMDLPELWGSCGHARTQAREGVCGCHGLWQ